MERVASLCAVSGLEQLPVFVISAVALPSRLLAFKLQDGASDLAGETAGQALPGEFRRAVTATALVGAALGADRDAGIQNCCARADAALATRAAKRGGPTRARAPAPIALPRLCIR